MIKKKRNLFIKLGLCVSAFVGLVCALTVSSKAYTFNDGDIISENLFNVDNLNSSNAVYSNGLVYSVSDYQFVINSSVGSGSYVYFKDVISLSPGTYSFSFDSSNELERIGFMLNNSTNFTLLWFNDVSSGSNTFTINDSITLGFGFRSSNSSNIKIMLNSGSNVLAWEPFGTFSDYKYSNVSLLDLANLQSATFYGWTTTSSGDSKYHDTFVKNGIFGYEDGLGWDLNLANFTTDSYLQNTLFEHIYSPYGMFYETDWTIWEWQYIEGSYGAPNEDVHSYLEYVFITPVNIYNTYFNNVNFTAIEFYDSSDNLLGVWTTPGFEVSLSGVAKIRCSDEVSDFGDEPVYLYCGPGTSDYNDGYVDGYNSRDNEINNLKTQINQLDNANAVLQQQLNNASSTNANALFWTIASTPFESFKTIWNVDVLGLNISGFVLGVLMALLILYIIKKVW